MNKKICFGIFALIFSIALVNAYSEDCTPQEYDSNWVCMNTGMNSVTKLSNYVVQISGDAWYYEDSPDNTCGKGFYYVDERTGFIKLKTGYLPFTGNYTFKIYYGIGTPNDIGTEEFTLKCGNKTYNFLDNDDAGDEVEFRVGEVTCNFNSGYNYIELKSTNNGSVHFKKFRILGELDCPEEPVCGNGICESGENCSNCVEDCGICPPVCGNGIKECGEQCDLNGLNGVPCTPAYNSTCTYCSNSCKNITLRGGFCGDGICQTENENCLTCSSDCACPSPESECVLTDAYWNVSNANAGESVSLIVHGINCTNKTILFNIYKKQNFGGDLFIETPGNATFSSSNLIYKIWKTIAPYNGDYNPVYYFIAKTEDGLKEIKSGDLHVNYEEEEKPKRPKSTPEILEVCNPNWKCSGWSECEEGIMTRKCIDENHCEILFNKPLETSGCSLLLKTKEETKRIDKLFLFGLIFLIILLIILLNLIKK